MTAAYGNYSYQQPMMQYQQEYSGIPEDNMYNPTTRPMPPYYNPGGETIVNGGWGNDTIHTRQLYGNEITLNGGFGYDTAVLEGSLSDYTQSTTYENGQCYRVFQDRNGKVIKIANDIENIQFEQQNNFNPWGGGGGYQDPFLNMLNQWFTDFLSMFFQMQNQKPPKERRHLEEKYQQVVDTEPTVPGDTRQDQLPEMNANKAIQTILNNFNICDTASGGGDTDGKIGKGDLQIIADSEGLDPELRAAAQFLLENKAVFSSIYANSSPFGRGEDRIDAMGLKVALNNFPPTANTDPVEDSTTDTLPQMDAKEALKTIMQNFNICDTASGGGDTDGKIGKGDLQIIANSEGLDPKLRAAAQFLLNNKAVFSNVYAKSSPFGRGEDRIDLMGLAGAYKAFGGE